MAIPVKTEMRFSRCFRFTLVFAISLAACGKTGAAVTQIAAPPATPSTEISSTSAPTVPTSEAPTVPPTAVTKTSASALTVVVLVDTRSQTATREQAQAVIDEASRLLRQLSPFGIEMVDFVEDSGGGSTSDMASRYVLANAPALPNGIVIFSAGDEGRAKLSGGYSYGLAAPAGYRNSFVSPVMGAGQLYVAVVDPGYKYAACGYGGSETVQSTKALSGECRDQPGTPCVEQNGYSMCADAVGNLYMSTPTYFAASTIVHQLLHPFAPDGERDHYNTPECNTRMGYPPAFFDLQESQYHNDLCPYVYEEFVKGHQP